MYKKSLIPLVVCCIHCPANAYMFVPEHMTHVISAPGDLALIPNNAETPFDILINDGGVYSLAVLDAMYDRVNQIKINFDMYGGGNNSPMVVLNADADFDGVFNPNIVIQDNTQIMLTRDFVDGAANENLLRFVNITVTNDHVNIFIEDDDNTYVLNHSGAQDYIFNNCGPGACVNSDYSNAYVAEQQADAYAIQLLTKGVQNNPKMLLYPMTLINLYNMVGYYDFSDTAFVSVAPEYYMAHNFYNSGVTIKSGMPVDGRLLIGVNANVAKSDFSNSVSDFKSYVYAGNLRFKYKIDDVLFVRGITGISFSDIDCSNVKKGSGVVNNPNAIGLYGGVDFGAKFDSGYGIFVSPFVGYGLHYEKVVDVRVRDSFLRFGNDIGFKSFMDGIAYNYVLRTGINSNGYFDAGFGFGVWLAADNIGGDISVGIMDSDMGVSGKVSANVKFVF